MAASTFLGSTSDAEARRGHHRRSHHAAKGGGYAPPYAAMVMDAKTGRIIHAQNEDEPRHPASVTKVMTLYLLFEAIESGKVSLHDEIPITARAAAQAPSKLGLRPGQTIEVEDAIKAVVTKSANDIACAIAEFLGGSEDDFAEQMTRKARQLGMSRTHYANASGLPDPDQITTARDLVTLARAIQDRFPTQYRYFQTRVFNYAGQSMRNHNHLLGKVEGVDGIKTGFTRASGFNLMTSARSEGRHVIAVVLGGRSASSRDQIVASLIRENIPRAYAGARTAPPVGEARGFAEAPRARAVEDVESTAATTARPIRLAEGIRPVVVSAPGGSSTTPSSSRWLSGSAPLPLSAQAYAQTDAPSAERAMPLPLNGSGKIDGRLPAIPPAPPRPEPVARSETSKREAPEPRREAAREAAKPAQMSAWVIQLGATDEEGKAKTILDQARSRSSGTLSRANGFTEKVVRDGATLYRARFSGFAEPDSAQDACRVLKRNGFACFATKS